MPTLLKGITVVIFVLQISHTAVCQNKQTDSSCTEMQKNIFRCIITFPFFPLDESTSITATYEREIKRPFTFVLQTGPSFSIHKFGTSNNPYQSSINAFASGEFRYYFNLNRRIKKGKLVKNFSTNYFSLQQYVVTNPLLIINDSRAFYGNSSSFINVG